MKILTHMQILNKQLNSDDKHLLYREQLELDIEQLVNAAHEILEKQPTIGFANFHQHCLTKLNSIDNSFLINELSSEAMLAVTGSPAKLQPLKISILGAGLAGLLAGVVLAKAGAEVNIYEKRSKIASRLRGQNISFKEAQLRLKPLLGPELYNKFFANGGALDGNTGKLRVTTGTFQDLLTQAAEDLPITIHYNATQTLDELTQDQTTTTVLVATGVHACERLNLSEHFNPLYFPEYQVQGQTALCLNTTTSEHGYFRGEREGKNWRRDNISIFSREEFNLDLERLQNLLTKQQAEPEVLQRLNKIMQQNELEYTFIFGNDGEEFFQDFPNSSKDYIFQTTTYKILPMLCTNLISEMNGKPIIAIGDANGSPHPLAAIGTLKFTRNISLLKDYLFNLQKLNSGPDILKYKLAELYELQAMQNNKEVFYGNILSCLYSSIDR